MELTLKNGGCIVDGDCSFRVVESVPIGYEIWNIPLDVLDGYLPLCRLADRQRFIGGRDIDTDTLCALKCEGAREIRSVCVSSGKITVAAVERELANYKRTKPGTWQHCNAQRLNAALPYMRAIKGLEGK